MKLTIGNEVLDTNTMTVRSVNFPYEDLTPWISLRNVRINTSLVLSSNSDGTDLGDLVITFKNGDQIKTYTKTNEVFFKDKRLTPNTEIQFEYKQKKFTIPLKTLLGVKGTYFGSMDPYFISFDIEYFMPVILQLYYSSDSYDQSTIQIDIESGLFEGINDIPEPLIEELRDKNKRITFLFSSSQQTFQEFPRAEKVYEVKSTENNPCNFYDNFLALAKFRLHSIKTERMDQSKQFISVNSKPQKRKLLPDLTKFYILCEKRLRPVTLLKRHGSVLKL